MNRVIICGIGPGSILYVTEAAKKAVRECDILVGGERNLLMFSDMNKRTYEFKSDLTSLLKYIKDNMKDKKICVIVSGDPGFYSLLDFLKKGLGEDFIEVIPGISSFQYLFCKLKKSWKDYALLSIHGRECDVFDYINSGKDVFLLTDKVNSPSNIAKLLNERGYGDIKLTVGERLSYSDERITIGRAFEISNMSFDELCVVVIENER